MFKLIKCVPLTLYVHFPWCIRKCPYCDFNSHALKTDLPEEKYIEVLLKDLENDLPKIKNRKITAIFFGGGTPSLFSPEKIDIFLKKLQTLINLEEEIEITLEANPGSVEQARFKDFHSIGVNRLSLGIQSFKDEHLKSLGRIHNGNQARIAIESIRKAGFSNFNLDLMHGLPHQSVEDALHDLESAISFDPPHLSWYQLTLEPNTAFHYRPPQLPPEELIWEMQDQGQLFLAQNGLQQYEISAYCKPGFQCKHNFNYWEFGDYLGIGAGAHSKLTDLTGNIERFWKIKHPKHYMDAVQFRDETKISTKKEIAFDFMLNRLRLMTPISISFFEERTGLSLSQIKENLDKAQDQGLLHLANQHITLTPLGKKFVNNILELFL